MTHRGDVNAVPLKKFSGQSMNVDGGLEFD